MGGPKLEKPDPKIRLFNDLLTIWIPKGLQRVLLRCQATQQVNSYHL